MTTSVLNLTQGLNINDLYNFVAKDNFTCTQLNNAITEGEQVINVPVLNTESTAYFVAEGSEPTLVDTSVIQNLQCSLGAIITPKLVSYQATRKLESDSQLKMTLLTEMTNSIFNAIDKALFSATDTTNSKIKSIIANATNNDSTITSDISTLYSFIAKLEPHLQKNAYLIMSQTTYNNLVKHLFLANENYILNVQDITKSSDLSILGIPVIINNFIATNKIVYMHQDAYLLCLDTVITTVENKRGNGNLTEIDLITTAGGIITDQAKLFVATISND